MLMSRRAFLATTAGVAALAAVPASVRAASLADNWLQSIRLRRGGDNVERQFYFDAAGNLDITAVQSFAAGGNLYIVSFSCPDRGYVCEQTVSRQPLALLADQTGNGNDVLGLGLSQQPVVAFPLHRRLY